MPSSLFVPFFHCLPSSDGFVVHQACCAYPVEILLFPAGWRPRSGLCQYMHVDQAQAVSHDITKAAVDDTALLCMLQARAHATAVMCHAKARVHVC